MEKIDFVIPWVNGSDLNWLTEKEQYKPGTLADASSHRYRDWDNLQYWFRGVEKFAPWVHKIYFITWGHVPAWLNIKHPKLQIVNHKDYIPTQYLPTFSANPIELNMHRIKGLEEKFVYFNDDMFLVSPVNECDFFEKGEPCDSAVLSVHCYQRGIIESHIPLSDVGVINDFFDMHQVIKRDFSKWLQPCYGLSLLLRSACLMPSPRFPGFWQHHLPTSFCKSTFQEVWEKVPEIMDETCSHKFRNTMDVNQWLMREWKICKGEFVPRGRKFGRSFHIDRKGLKILPDIQEYIEKQKGKIVVINDGVMSEKEFDDAREKICSSFQKILPEKSEFEL